jgi:hypothetical protein
VKIDNPTIERVKSFVLIFLIVYGPVLDTFLGPILDISFIVCILIIVERIIFCSKIIIEPVVGQLIAILFIIFILCLFNSIFIDSENFVHSLRALLRPIRVIAIIIAIAIVSNRFVEQNNVFAMRAGMKVLFSVIVFHSVIMVFQFFSESFRNAIYQFTTAKHVLDIYQNTRMAGVTGAGGAQLSISQSLGLILGVYLFVEAKKIKGKVTIFLLCLLILASIILCGRSGLLTAFIFCPIYFLYTNTISKNVSRNFLVSIFLILLSSFFVYMFLIDSIENNNNISSVIERIFDSFIAARDGGEFRVNTLSVLSNMFILPDGFFHLLFGKASYLNNNTLYNIDTDIGYFRLIWGYGFVGSIFHYLFYVYSIFYITTLSQLSKLDKSVPIVLLLLILFFNLKEILIFSKLSFQITMFCFFLAYYSNSKYKKLSIGGLHAK